MAALTPWLQHGLLVVLFAVGLDPVGAEVGTPGNGPVRSLQEPAGIEAFTARFTLGNGRIDVGSVTMQLQPEAGRWRFSSASRATGVFALFRNDQTRETSWLAADPAAIRPLEYQFNQKGSRQKNIQTIFDWKQRQVRTTYGSDEPTVHPLSAGTQDRLSVLLELILASRNGADSVVMKVNEKGSMRTWRFELQGRESVTTEAGVFEAVKVVQTPSSRKRHTITWLAPALDHLPIRLEQYKNNELKIRMDLNRIERSGRTAD